MDLQEFFDDLPEAEILGEELQELLTRLIAITNPMDFNDDFATDEQLEALENSLDNLEIGMPVANQLKGQVINSRAIQTSIATFI